jgi:parvulin-like peptidyl-prolyl isomerase
VISGFVEKARPLGAAVMARSRQANLSVEKEAEVQALASRIRELADEELVEIARLLVSKPEHETFGETEYELRGMVLKVGAKALEEHLRLKKTAIEAAASIVAPANKPPSSKATGPSR